MLFTLLAERYERRSVMVTSNLVFSQWDRIFRDQMATAAAIDRLVHHAVVLEFDVTSYRTDRSRRKAPPAPAPRRAGSRAAVAPGSSAVDLVKPGRVRVRAPVDGASGVENARASKPRVASRRVFHPALDGAERRPHHPQESTLLLVHTLKTIQNRPE